MEVKGPESSPANPSLITESAKILVADSVPEVAQEKGKADLEKKVEDEEDESQYPSTKKVIVIVTALYLALLLVALVCQTHRICAVYSLMHSPGPDHHFHGRTPYY